MVDPWMTNGVGSLRRRHLDPPQRICCAPMAGGAEFEQQGAVTGPPGPLRVTIGDDLQRSRLTVFFRLLLAIPHLVWLTLWGILMIGVAIVNWFAVLFTASPIATGLIERFLRYETHVWAYLSLAANPFPASPARRAATRSI